VPDIVLAVTITFKGARFPHVTQPPHNLTAISADKKLHK